LAADLLRRRIGRLVRRGLAAAFLGLGKGPLGLGRQDARRLGGCAALLIGGGRHLLQTWGYRRPWLFAVIDTI
jgi:hypothetical protein